MALVYYPFEGRDSTITTGDNRKTSLTVTVVAIKTLTASPATVSTGQATIVEVGLGAYEVAYDPEANGDAVIALDLSATLSNPSDRYVNIATTREPGRTNTALPNAAPGTTGGLDVPISEAGTMQAGSTSTTAVLRSGASVTNKIYDGGTIQILSGTGVGQARTIAYYNGSTKTATIAGAWATTPDNTSVYAIRMANTPIIDATGDLLASVTNSTTVVIGSGASATDSIYVGAPLKIIAGTGAGQTRTITAYVGSNKTATVDHAYSPVPDATSVYRVGLAENATLDGSGRVTLTPAEHTAISGTDVPMALAASGVTLAVMRQISARLGSSSITGNKITYTTLDGQHTFTLTVTSTGGAPSSGVLTEAT